MSRVANVGHQQFCQFLPCCRSANCEVFRQKGGQEVQSFRNVHWLSQIRKTVDLANRYSLIIKGWSRLTCRPPATLKRNNNTFPASSSPSSGGSKQNVSLASSYSEPESHWFCSTVSPRSTSSRSPLSSAPRIIMLESSRRSSMYGSAKLALTACGSASCVSSVNGNNCARPNSTRY